MNLDGKGQLIDIPSCMIEKIEGSVLKLPEIKKLLSSIQQLDTELIETDIYLDEVKSHISIWDRINVFNKTDQEVLEEELKDDMGEQSEKMIDLLMQVDQALREAARGLMITDATFRQYVIWTELHRLRGLISGIELEYSHLRSDSRMGYTLKGKAESEGVAAELEELVRLSPEDPVSMGIILQEVKKRLIENHCLSPPRN